MHAPVHVETLPEGPTLLLREAHVAPVAEVQVLARVGAADEGPDEAGLAHFHEHMLFKGTETRGVGEIAGNIEGVGGRINAWTSFDTTCYHATLPSDAIAVGLDVLADATQHSLFDPEETRREIGVVLEEIRRSEDEPHHVLSDLIFATAYQAHPYRAPILGSHESVSSLTPERLQAFYRRWYTPTNLVVVATGDFETDWMRERIAAAFGQAESAAPERRRAAEPGQKSLRVALERRPFERACVDLSWPATNLAHPDTPLLDLLAYVLGGGESSRLVRRVKEEAGLCDRIDASCYTPFDPGLFGASVDLEPEQTEAAVEAIVRETERMRREPVSSAELERARANFLASQAWEGESVSGMARKLGSFHLLAGDHRQADRYLDAVRTATAQDLQRVAEAYLGKHCLSIAGVLPDGAGTLTEEGIRSAVRRAGERASRAAAAPRHETRPPAAKPTGSARSEEIQTYALTSGARLVVTPRPDVPVVAVRAAMLGGQLSETEGAAGLAGFLAGMWLRGTRGRSSADFAREVENLAGDIDGFSGRNSSGLTMDATREQFLPVLDLFCEAILSPGFAADEIERERRDTLAAIARREDRLSARAFDLFHSTEFQRHPYRLPLTGTLETVARFDREALEAAHQQIVGGENLVVAVAGDIDPDDAAGEISRRLGELSSGHDLTANLPEEEERTAGVRIAEEFKDRAQAHLVVGFRGLSVHDPDRTALEMLSQTLGGQGGRLFLELRDRQSLAYAVTAVNVEGVAPGSFAVYIATAPEKLEQAKSGITDELHRAASECLPDSEIERARRYLIGHHAIDAQRSSGRALQLALDTRYGLGPEAHSLYPEQVRNVTAEDVRRVAERVIDFNAMTQAIIRPEGP
ncbi:MAG: insulinase family protein [bacterium]|nr:insulinase family protein [bacterium]